MSSSLTEGRVAAACSAGEAPPTSPLEEALSQCWAAPASSSAQALLNRAIFNCRARGGVLLLKEGNQRRRLIALWADGRPIGRPDRLLREPTAKRAQTESRAIVEAVPSEGGPSAGAPGAPATWNVALPLPLGPGRSGLLYLSGASLSPAAPPLSLDAREQSRWAAYAATTLAVDALGEECRELRRALRRWTLRSDGTAGDAPAGGASANQTTDGGGADSTADGGAVANGARGARGEPGVPVHEPVEATRIATSEIVGESSEIVAIHRSIAVLARSDLPVLIEGESGTGKELVARAIHRLGRRAAQPFVTQNCGAIPVGLIESELFGHDRGAFTGAHEERPGIFERASGGTVFLDEIGEMNLDTQKSLLRVLQEGEVRRVGGRCERRVDFRVISATNRVLESAVEQRQFREDLYYRLNVATIRLPPLRERASDIPLLLEHFARRSAAELDRPELEFSAAARSVLQHYPWPGNVRELRNEVRRLACTTQGRIEREQLAERILRRGPRPLPTRLRSLVELEKELIAPVIDDAIRQADGNRAEAARRLGITRADLYRRLRRYGRLVPRSGGWSTRHEPAPVLESQGFRHEERP